MSLFYVISEAIVLDSQVFGHSNQKRTLYRKTDFFISKMSHSFWPASIHTAGDISSKIMNKSNFLNKWLSVRL